MENPTSDEKVMAALAHVSVLFSFFGPFIPTLIWVSQRDKSKYVRFHALQAMGYQAFTFWAWFIGMFVMAFGFVILAFMVEVLFMGNNNLERDGSLAPIIIQPLFILGIMGIWGLFFLIGILGAIFCMIDRGFTYPLIGHWLRRRLFASEATEEDFDKWEEHWVSGVCHSTVILQLFGIITPMIVWYTQKEKSVRLQFQALQAIFYQLISIIASILGYIFGAGVYILLIAMLILGVAFVEPSVESSPELSPIFTVMFFLVIGVAMVIWLISFIVAPLYYLLGIIASLRNISGHDFHYPILGKIISRRLSQKVISAETSS